MHIKKVFHTWRQKINKIPRPHLIVMGLALFMVSLYIVSFRERTVDYSYGGETCEQQFILLPQLFKPSGGDDYIITTSGGLNLWGYPILSSSLCITANKLPSNDAKPVAISLFGSWFARISYKVHVPEAPKAFFDVFETPLATTKPLILPLSEPDDTFSYTIHSDETSAPCESKDKNLSCDIPALKLRQSSEYSLSVTRSFKDEEPETLTKVSVKTLSPVIITTSSIATDAVIYDKPQQLIIEADKLLKTTTFVLTKVEGETRTVIPVETTVEDKKVTIKFLAELARSSQFELAATSFIATDDSTLLDPYILKFKTSGGPTVAGVSVGSTAVPQTAQIIVTFDQPIKDSVDITRFARVTGVTGTVRKQSATQIVFSLQNAPLCAAFSLVVDKGVQSGSNEALSQEAWKFDARTICGSSSVIGYSVRGRAIVAYYFGTGATTVLFTGGMHGSEPSGTSTMKAFVDYLQVNGYKIPSSKRVIVVPNTNPDAIAIGSRNNANNVNIDRNFPTANWTSSIETSSGTLPNGGGTSPGSEPETQALMALTRQFQPRLEVSFHAKGSLVGANKVGDSVAIGDIYANLVGYNTMFYNAEEVMGGYAMTGEYEDWMGEEGGTPAILIELPTASGNYLQSQLTALWRMISV